MAKCTQLAYPGQGSSDLYNTIYNSIANKDEELAQEYYSEFFTPEFMKEFGDWMGDYDRRLKNSQLKEGEKPTDIKVGFNRVDPLGEPKLFEDAAEGRYYYINKFGIKRYFPSRVAGLHDSYAYSEILNVSKILAFNYIKSTNLNFSDLSISSIEESLSESIKNKIKATADKLMNSGDPDKVEEGQALLDSTDYLEEWEQHVKDYFRGLKIVYTEEREEQEIETEEESTRTEQFGTASFERSMKENISTNIKLRLSLLQDPNVKDPIFNEPIFVPFDEVYSTLLHKLTNRVAVNENGSYEDLFDLYLKEVEGLMYRKPQFKSLYKGLKDADENLKYEFVQAFNLDKYNFMTTEVRVNKKNPNKRSYIVMNVSGVGSKGKTIQSNWHNNYLGHYVNKFGNFLKKRDESRTYYVINREQEISDRADSVNRVLRAFSKKRGKKEFKTEEDIAKAKKYVMDMLDLLGVPVSVDAFDLYLDGLNMNRASLEERMDVLETTLESMSVMLTDLRSGRIKPNDNPFATQNIFNALADAEAFYTNEGSDANIFAAGKSKWVYSKPSYLTHQVKSWKKNPKILEAKLNTTYGKSSKFIKYLLAHDKVGEEREKFSQERLNNLEVTTFNTFQEKGKGKEAKENKDISINDFHTDTINKVLRPDPNPAIYSSPTPADKGTHYQLQIGYRVKANATVLGDDSTSIDGNVTEIFYEYFESEYNRMKEVLKEIQDANSEGKTEELVVHYHLGRKNGLKSQLFPSLSFDKFEGKIAGHAFELYDKEGNPAVEDLTVIKEELMDYIEAELIRGIQTTKERFYEKGIVVTNEEGVVEFPGVSTAIVEEYRQLRSEYLDLRIAADTYLNGMISQVEYSKMFSGDVAYYKDSIDYKKRIPATYTDGLQLRLRGYHDVVDKTERDLLRQGEYRFNASVIEGVEVGSPAFRKLKKMLKPEIAKYYLGKENGGDDINSTDAQAWITPQRWKFLMQRMGKWDSTFDALYNKVMSGKNVTLTEKDLKKVMQPLKGVYFDINEGRPVYLKYSQAVLIPNLIKNSPLQRIYDKMILDDAGNEKPFHEQIHETITIDGVKVGAINPVKTHSNDGKVLEDFALTSMSLSNSGWKLQQDLPTKTFKSTAVGSQIQKNIFGGLANNLDATFLVGESEMSGKDLIEHINSIVEGLSDRGKGALIDDFGITTGGGFGNVDSVYKNLIEELKSRGGNQNIVDALEARITPYGIPQAQKTLMNVLSSMFLKKLVKIKTNGGAFIQLSNYGLSKTEAEEQGIIWSPKVEIGATTQEPSILEDEEGNPILTESGNRIIKPGEVLVSGSFIAKHIPEYKKYKPEQLFGVYNKSTGKYEDYIDENGEKKAPIIDQEILQGLVGYRIPNQALASNDALEIVGIMPEETGDTIVAYTGITTKTGSDFDIDKMYLMMPSFLPYRGVKSRLRDTVRKHFTKNTKRETLAELQLLKDSLGLETNLNELARLLSGTENEKLLNKRLDKFILDVLDNRSNGNGGDIVRIIESLAATETVERLRYATPETVMDKEGKESIAPPDQQSREALNNMLIESYKAVLTNPVTINEVMTPIDYDFMKDDINDLKRRGEAKDLDDFDIFKDIDLKYEFLAGKAGVGQEANALVDHVRGLMADLTIRDTFLGRGNKEGKETILDREFSEGLSDAELRAYFNDYNEGKEEEDRLSWEAVQKLKSVKIANSLSAVLNAFVDIAKDPYITRGNWTTQTTNTGNMLLRAGFHPFYVNAFMAQPVISRYIDFITNKESKLVNDTGNMKNKFRVELVKEQLVDKFVDTPDGPISYTKLYEDLVTEKGVVRNALIEGILYTEELDNFIATADAAGDTELAKAYETIQSLHKQVFPTTPKKGEKKEQRYIVSAPLSTLRKQIKNKEDFTTQVDAINQFFEWQDLTKSLRQSVIASKIDVSGYGKSIGSLINMDNTIAKLLATKGVKAGDIVGFKDKLRKNNKNTLLGAYKKNIIDWTKQIMEANPQMFLTAQPFIVNTYNQISLDVKKDLLVDETLTDKIEEGYYSYLLSGFEPLQIDAEEREYLVNQFPYDVEAIIESDAVQEAIKEDKYRLLSELYLKPGEEGITYLAMSNRKKSPELESEITASWRDVLDGDFDEIMPGLGEKLIKYAYMTSGFRMNINQFFTYIPTSWFIENNIDTYIAATAREMGTKTKNSYDHDFLDQFYRHNMADNQLVPNISKGMVKKLQKHAGFVTKTKEKQARRFVKMNFRSSRDGGLTVKEETYLYKLQGYTKEGEGVYTKVSLLGSDTLSGNTYEYNYNEHIPVSSIPANYEKADIIKDVVDGLEDSAKLPAHAYNPIIHTGEVDLNKKIEDETNCNLDEL